MDKSIAEDGQPEDWRTATLSRVHRLIETADPDVVEEVKWAESTSRGVPTWSHDSIRAAVALNASKGR